jgi:hypothetical protein
MVLATGRRIPQADQVTRTVLPGSQHEGERPSEVQSLRGAGAEEEMWTFRPSSAGC